MPGLKLFLVPSEVNQILLKREAFGPFGSRPHGLEVFDARHDGVVALDDIIHSKHANSKLRRLQFLWDVEVYRYERLRGLWRGRDECGDCVVTLWSECSEREFRGDRKPRASGGS
jgi:hypothetical protein